MTIVRKFAVCLVSENYHRGRHEEESSNHKLIIACDFDLVVQPEALSRVKRIEQVVQLDAKDAFEGMIVEEDDKNRFLYTKAASVAWDSTRPRGKRWGYGLQLRLPSEPRGALPADSGPGYPHAEGRSPIGLQNLIRTPRYRQRFHN